MTARRLDTGAGAAQLSFSFDGRAMTGRAGDTLASALLANGVRVVGRSFKYHRPRGIWGAWVEEPNAIVDVEAGGRRTPNVRATTELLADGMTLRSVNTAPDAARDRSAVLDRLGRFLPAGFYYKTFMRPSWAFWEPRIRAMAGLGRLDPQTAPPADCPHVNARCDLLVMGAGPAGLSAALAGLASGKSVTIVDDRPEPGGSLLWRETAIDGQPGADWAASALAKLRDGGARVLSRATAFGVYDHRLVAVWERRDGAPDRLWRLRPGRIVLATGAIERPLVFPDNDRPGVMSAEAALAYLRLHDVLVGERIVLATATDAAYAAAAALAAAGASVEIADLRDAPGPAPEGVRVRTGAVIAGVEGRGGVEAVRLADGARLEADCLLVSGGYTPSVHLFCQAGGRLRLDEAIGALVAAEPLPGIALAGAAAGAFGLSTALDSGHRAVSADGQPPRAESEDPSGVRPAWPAPGSRGRQWIDLQSDVTLKDVEIAAREGFRSVEHLKRYTTLGMATDQGKTSNMNGLAAMAAITGLGIAATGTTRYRPPYVPVPLPVVAGRRRGELFAPVRRLVLEGAHRDAGATFREYGGWLRPAWHGRGDPAARIAHEAAQARHAVGLFDGSPLGKIEVMGPGAAALLDFVFYTRLSTLRPGRLRYALMLTEGGAVFDDGVVARLAEDRFVVSASSSHVPAVVRVLEEWRQDRFDRARVVIHDTTAHWATLTATGPRSRQLVERLDLGTDLDDATLPHMTLAEGRFRDAPARVARVSFTGDRSYEVSVPASAAPALWAAMQEAGRDLDATPLGIEALMILRAEKGFIVVGKDTDGTTLPMDLGFSGPRRNRDDEYVGRRSLFTEEAGRPDRLDLVGFAAAGPDPLPPGAHVVEERQGARRSVGFVTSSYSSPTLGRPVALGMLAGGRERIGEEVTLYHLGRTLRATVAAPCALDPEGERLNA